VWVCARSSSSPAHAGGSGPTARSQACRVARDGAGW
jgi:hypothetical protein